MKNGKAPTLRQKKLMQSKRLNPADWLVSKDTPEKMLLVHRHFDHVKKIIYKGERNYD